jgi:hypothetical protein
MFTENGYATIHSWSWASTGRYRAAIGATAIALAGATPSLPAVAAETERLVEVAIIESGRAEIASEMLIVTRGSDRTPTSESSRSVATLRLPNGASIEFIDSGDGYVDIGERTGERMPFVTPEMLAQSTATPLEIFKALAPGRSIPNILVLDHNRRSTGAHVASARDLVAPASASFALDDPGLEPYTCDVLFIADYWVGDWEEAFEGVTQYSAAAYIHHWPAYTFYPGAAAYYGTGTNRQTYLGACNGTADAQFTMYIDRWVVTNVAPNPSPQPPTVTWGWGNIHDVVLQNGEKYTYYSGHPNGRYRGRVEGLVSHQGIGAAWTPSFPIGFGTP